MLSIGMTDFKTLAIVMTFVVVAFFIWMVYDLFGSRIRKPKDYKEATKEIMSRLKKLKKELK